MTEFKSKIKGYLLALGFTEQPTSQGLCFFYRHCAGDWCGQDWAEVNSNENELKPLFKDGKFLRTTTLTEIRNKVNG